MQDKGTVTVRQSGIELLRIIAAIGIILIHIGDGKLNADLSVTPANHIALFTIESFAHCCVNLFILITGYFMIKSDRRSWDKPIDLIVQVILIQTAMFVVYLLTHRLEFTLNNVALYCTPNNYFVILFVVLYLISPYINQLLRKLSPGEWKMLLLVSMAIFSVYATFVDLYGEIVGQKWFGLSPVGAWGNQQGFTIVNFLLIYIWGGVFSNEWHRRQDNNKAGIDRFHFMHSYVLSLGRDERTFEPSGTSQCLVLS